MGTQKNRLNETVLLSTQNTCLNGWISKYLQFYAYFSCLSKPMEGEKERRDRDGERERRGKERREREMERERKRPVMQPFGNMTLPGGL